MITEDYVSFETAQLLKEKGFDESVNRFYEISTGKPSLVRSEYCRNSFTIDYAAPTHQMALKWMREAHAICIEVCRNINTFYYSYRVIQGASFVKLLDWSDSYDTYEQAVEAALKYTLENLI